MNSEPLNEVQELPSRDELIRYLGRQKSSIAAVYDANGEQVHLGGRAPKLPEAPVVADTSRVARCAICDAASGEVTLMRIDQHSELAAKLRDELGISAVYTCFGGNCAGQRNSALMRLFKRARFGANRLTKVGHAMRWAKDSAGEMVRVYARTGRSHKQAKARRVIQSASRRANRSN